MVRTPSSDKNGLKRGSWSEEEDNKLIAYIEKYGHWNWRQLPKFAGLSRCGKSCRLRWMNYLRPDVKHGNYSKEEKHMIMKLHDELGNKWSAIAAHLPGRADNEIKNFWHTHIKKRGKSNPTSEVTAQSDLSFKPQPNQKEQFEETSNSKANDQNIEQAHESDVSSDTTSLHISSSSMSTNLRSTNWDAEDGMALSSLESFAGPLGNFWSEPFLEDTFYYQNYYSSPSTQGGLMSPYLLYDDDAINLFHH